MLAESCSQRLSRSWRWSVATHPLCCFALWVACKFEHCLRQVCKHATSMHGCAMSVSFNTAKHARTQLDASSNIYIKPNTILRFQLFCRCNHGLRAGRHPALAFMRCFQLTTLTSSANCGCSACRSLCHSRLMHLAADGLSVEAAPLLA